MVAVAVLAASMTTVLATPADAALCFLDSGAHALTVTSAAGILSIRSVSGYLEVTENAFTGGSFCALMSDLDTVTISLTGTTQQLRFDLEAPLGPGYTDEGDGSSELEFDVSGLDAADGLRIEGGGGGDGIWFEERIVLPSIVQRVNLNALVDGTSKDADVTLRGAPGLATVYGWDGDDVLTGQGFGTIGSKIYPYALSLHDGDGADTVRGGSGDDVLAIADHEIDGSDVVSGGVGEDMLRIIGSSSDASASLSLDDVANDGYLCPGFQCDGDNLASDMEIVLGGITNEEIIGGPGPQTLRGGPGSDDIEGGGGDDILFGFGDPYPSLDGSNDLRGGAGHDLLVGAESADRFFGGPGFDAVSYEDATARVRVSLNGVADDGAAGEEDDVSGDVERVLGSPKNDVLVGNAKPNMFSGMRGNDRLLGRAGDDVLIGNAGDDAFEGGSGFDLCRQGPGMGSKDGCERR